MVFKRQNQKLAKEYYVNKNTIMKICIDNYKCLTNKFIKKLLANSLLL
jgi:hypothetical protein